MTARVVALAISVAAGCGTRPATTPPITVAPPADAALAPVAAAAPAVILGTQRRAAIEAPHAGPIRTLAVTPDGTAAITSDELGGIRLWPTLDASREPRVVELPAPRALAIGPRPGGFTVVVLDLASGIVVADVDVDGRVRSHATLAAEPAFTGIAMTDLGPLAWRADHTIELLDDDGATRARIGTKPGEQLVGIAAIGRHALVIISTANGKRARWLVLGPKLAWGSWIDAGSDLSAEVALSPSGSRFATLGSAARTPPHVIVVATATGKVVANEPAPAATTLAFSDDDHLAIGRAGSIAWLDLGAAKPKPSAISTTGASDRGAVLASGGGRVVAAGGSELVLATPSGIEFLGYELESPTVAAVAPDGKLLVGLADQLVLLDRDLLPAGAPLALAVPIGSAVSGLRWLGGDEWLVAASTLGKATTSLSIVDGAHGKATVVRTGMAVVPLIRYEPTTHLVTLSLGDAPEVDRFDPATRALVRLAAIPKAKTYQQSELVPVAPSLAGGAQLVRVTMPDPMTIQWLRDPRALDRPSATVNLEGSLAGADAAGHVYVWRNAPSGALELVVYVGATPIATLAHDGPVALWPDPTGARVVEIGSRTIALYLIDGTPLWTRELVGATEALWLADGAIAIITAAGIARLAPVTGAVTAARCGWKLGRSPKPHPASASIEPVCVQLVR